MFLCFSQNFSQALESNYNHSTIKIVPDQILLSDDNYFYFGIEINLEKGWKTYWKNPGDAGAPITIEFDNNQGILEKKFYFLFLKNLLINQSLQLVMKIELYFQLD